jgi:hypothetical protein
LITRFNYPSGIGGIKPASINAFICFLGLSINSIIRASLFI